MRKIGVLTYTREYANLGTNMQAYCTLRAIQAAFPESSVELIDYAIWRPVMRPYLSAVTVRSLRNDCTRIAKYRRFMEAELVFSRSRLISSNLEESLRFIRDQHYDAIFVGSDTVLELRQASADALNAFWLHPSVRSKKCLIAASAHSLTYERLSTAQKKQMSATIDDFELLGVRDDATRRLLAHCTGGGDERLRLVPDPTFTYPVDHGPAERYLRQHGITFDRPVVCLHLLRHTPWAEALAAKFRRAGFTVASLRPAHYADVLFTDLSPFEQVGIYRSFSLVITHRFHDAVFCFKNLTPVIVFPEHAADVTPHGESKNHSLLRSFGIEPQFGPGRTLEPTADYLFEIHTDVIRSFESGRERIQAVLHDNKSRYEAYLQESRRRVA